MPPSAFLLSDFCYDIINTCTKQSVSKTNMNTSSREGCGP